MLICLQIYLYWHSSISYYVTNFVKFNFLYKIANIFGKLILEINYYYFCYNINPILEKLFLNLKRYFFHFNLLFYTICGILTILFLLKKGNYSSFIWFIFKIKEPFCFYILKFTTYIISFPIIPYHNCFFIIQFLLK